MVRQIYHENTVSFSKQLQEKYSGIEVIGNIAPNQPCRVESMTHGLFACFYCLLYGIYICEMEEVEPIAFLGESHLYFEKENGGNVFEYYYKKKHKFTEKSIHELPIIIVSNPGKFLKWCRISIFEKKMSNLIISKYFTLKNDIRKILSEFEKSNFAHSNILGVHYRGTDKITETPIAEFDEYERKIQVALESNLFNKIFFCSDEFKLRERVKKKFGNKIISYQTTADYGRNNENLELGIHFTQSTPFLAGRDALIECYLLSRCNALLSSSRSSMSLFATFINPDLFHIVLEP